jgi:hypothetical protein
MVQIVLRKWEGRRAGPEGCGVVLSWGSEGAGDRDCLRSNKADPGEAERVEGRGKKEKDNKSSQYGGQNQILPRIK